MSNSPLYLSTHHSNIVAVLLFRLLHSPMRIQSMIRAFTFHLLIISLLVSISIPITSNVAVAQQADTQSTTLNLPGLRERTTIRRDERGIPYIDARNEHDLYFAQGYATAVDRLWQMDFLRRTARGELSEVLGAGPNNLALEQDKVHRTYGFAQVADAEFAQATPEGRAVIQAYADGVNAFISSLDSKSLPPEFQILQYRPREWTPSDSLVLVKLFFEALS